MANLRSGSKVDNNRIITEDIASNHIHNASQIEGLPDSVIGDSDIYAERIDGRTYSYLQYLFVSESNNAMRGSLLVNGSPSSDQSIVSKGTADALFSDLNVSYYDIVQLDPISVQFSNNSILVSDNDGYVDSSWTNTTTTYPVNISIYGPRSALRSGDIRSLEITNYDSFSTYNVSVNIGTVELGNSGRIVYTAPPSNNTETDIVINVTKGPVSKTITLRLLAD